MTRRPIPTPPLALAALLAWGQAPPSLAPGWIGGVREAIRSGHRNAADSERMERGYYEAVAGRRLDRLAPEAPPPDFGLLTLPVAAVRSRVPDHPPGGFRLGRRPAMIDPKAPRPSLARVLLTASLLGAGVAPLPVGWARSAREAVRSPDRDRSAGSGGYYEGLIAGEGRDRRGAPNALEVCLVGDPIRENRDLVRRITRDRKDDFLQFDLKPDHDEVFFGRRFTTNSRGMRDREYAPGKPEGIYRIALLGASIDMGWGVATPETYENLLEAWLNAEAARRGLSRRFEILNFAVVAYGPAQRFDAFRRRALPFAPDLVLYSSTMLDPRLVEIHLGGLIKNRVDLTYEFLRRAAAEAGIDPDRERSNAWSDLDRRGGFKARVKDHYWSFAGAALGALAADCRSADIPLACLLVPRANRDEPGDARDLAAARHAGTAARHAVPLLDLTATFDPVEPSQVEIAPGDDHPNTLGHRLLFQGLTRALLADPALARHLFEPAR